jgi:nucleoside-diphosphate-sugar epimerase
VVQANLLAMSAGKAKGEAINIACGKRTSLNQLLDFLGKILGREVSPVYEKAREGDVKHSLADIRKGKDLLNYVPQVEIEIGLRRTVDYFRERFHSS